MELIDSVLILYQNSAFSRCQSRRISLSFNGSVIPFFDGGGNDIFLYSSCLQILYVNIVILRYCRQC